MRINDESLGFRIIDWFMTYAGPWILILGTLGLVAFTFWALFSGPPMLPHEAQQRPKIETATVVQAFDDGNVQIEVIEINGNRYVLAGTYHGLAICPETKPEAEKR